MVENINCTGNYLSENIVRFPFAEEGNIKFINKGITGCGGTTIAIETAKKENASIVLLMPTVSAIQSKKQQFPEAVALFGNNYLNVEQQRFITNNIILATYDKFENIKTDLLRKENYYLVIDEYHTLTRDAGYRKCMASLLKDWDSFKSVTLLTATPDEHLINAVRNIYSSSNISQLNYVWGEKRFCNLTNVEGSLHNYLVDLVKNWSYVNENNLYLMLNNIKEINSIIEEAGLVEYHVQCSESRENEVKRSSIEDINKDLKPINFLTASGFEGCDIKDPNGVIYTVVDLNANSTIFDWQTLVQMQGRCRGSKEYPHVLYHYSKLREDQLTELKNKVKALKLAKIELGDKTVREVLNDDDYLVVNNNIVINPFKESVIAREKEIFENCQTYKSFFDYLSSKGYIVVTSAEKVKKENVKKNVGFKELCKMYEAGQDTKGYKRSVLVNKAYSVLGKDKVKETGYSEKMCLNLLKLNENKYMDPKEFLELKPGRFYTSNAIIKALEEINKYLQNQLMQQSASKKGKVTIETDSPYDGAELQYLQNQLISTDERLLPITLNSLGYLVKPIRKKVDGKDIRGYEVLANKENDINEVDKVIAKVNPTLNFSISTKPGVKVSRPMFDKVSQLESIVKPRPAEKKDQWYMSDCYNSSETSYARKETSFTSVDCIIIDIDGGVTIDELNEYINKNYCSAVHYIYKTFSYTEEKQKFRVIFPLSETLTFRSDLSDTKNFKAAKIQMFPEIHDTNCQLWFFSPNEVPEMFGNSSIALNAKYVRKLMDIIGVAKDEETDIIEIKVPKQPTKPTTTPKNTDYEASKFIKMINDAVDGEWNDKIWAAAYYVKWEDIDKVKEGIVDPLKLRYFEEKLRYKRK